MKRIFLLTILAVLCAPFAFAQKDAERANAFVLESKHLPVAERIERATQTIQISADQVLVGEAARDLARFAKTPEHAETALAELDALILKSSPGSYTFHWGNLAKARVLVRLGRNNEALAIFKAAINERWDKNVYREFFESFEETSDHVQLALEEYNRTTGDSYSEEVREFFGLGGDLLGVYSQLRGMRSMHPETSAMETILPQLKDSANRPAASRIARAFCLATDDRYEEALAQLDEITGFLASKDSPPSTYNESKDLPLYRAAILLFEGRDYEAMRAAFRQYMDLNTDDRGKVLARAVSLTYALEHFQKDLPRIPELTTFIVNSEYFTDPQIESQLPEGSIASLLTMHQLGLSWRYEWEEASRVCLMIMDRFYPQTLSGASAAMNYGLYLWREKYDYDGAKAMFEDILERAPYDGIAPHVKQLKAQLAVEMRQYDEAIPLLDDAINQIGSNEKESLRRCRDLCIKLREKAINLRDSGARPPKPLGRDLPRVPSGGLYAPPKNDSSSRRSE
ncbi:MAG TPA: hypothetical protein PKJ23_17700 [bacterium]|nr:hypothetical protein [bacterium]